MFDKLDRVFKDNKFFTVSKVDGFLTAVISSPNLIHPLEWTQIIKINQVDLEILFDFYNQIYSSLKDGSYSPIFVNSGKEDLYVELGDWVHGYLWGKNLWDLKIVKTYKSDIDVFFSKIMQLLNVGKISNDSINILSTTCVDVYKFWLRIIVRNS